MESKKYTVDLEFSRVRTSEFTVSTATLIPLVDVTEKFSSS